MSERRVAVVTGGTAGVGRAVVRELASHGWDVAVLARCDEASGRRRSPFRSARQHSAMEAVGATGRRSPEACTLAARDAKVVLPGVVARLPHAGAVAPGLERDDRPQSARVLDLSPDGGPGPAMPDGGARPELTLGTARTGWGRFAGVFVRRCGYVGTKDHTERWDQACNWQWSGSAGWAPTSYAVSWPPVMTVSSSTPTRTPSAELAGEGATGSQLARRHGRQAGAAPRRLDHGARRRPDRRGRHRPGRAPRARATRSSTAGTPTTATTSPAPRPSPRRASTTSTSAPAAASGAATADTAS